MNQAMEILVRLDARLFIAEFSVDEELSKISRLFPEWNEHLARRLLELIVQVKATELEHRRGTIQHPLAKHFPFADVQTIDFSESCFRLKEWYAKLGGAFADMEQCVIEKAVERYVYLRHLR